MSSFFGDPFIAFRRNWFNGLFHNDGILFYLHNYLQRFYDILKVDNKLIKPVLSDLQMQSFVCVCRALGLINKFLTGSLRRLLESGIHIRDFNKH